MSLFVEILLTLFYLCLFIYIIIKSSFFRLEGVNKKALPVVFIIKVAMGTLLALVYSYYYPDRLKADVFKYFDDSKIMFDALFHKPLDFFQMLFGIKNNTAYFDNYYTLMNNWYRQYETNIYNDSHIIIRFNAIVRIFSFGFFSVHTVFMSFIALAGQTALYKFFRKNVDLQTSLVFISVFLVPSVIFWSSGVLKEGLLFFGLGFFIYYSYLLIQRFSLLNMLWVIFSLILLAYLKFYILASLLPLLLTYFWCVKTDNRKKHLKYGITIMSMIIIGFNFQLFFPDYNLMKIMVNKQNDFFYLALNQNSGSLFFVEKLKPDFISILRNAPKAFFNVFFLPHIFMKQSVLSFFSAAENTLLFLLFIVTLLNFKIKDRVNSFFLLCLFFTIFTFILIGLTTPVYGAIVRYKIPALPFMVLLLFLCLDMDKIKHRIVLFKKYFYSKTKIL